MSAGSPLNPNQAPSTPARLASGGLALILAGIVAVLVGTEAVRRYGAYFTIPPEMVAKIQADRPKDGSSAVPSMESQALEREANREVAVKNSALSLAILGASLGAFFGLVEGVVRVSIARVLIGIIAGVLFGAAGGIGAAFGGPLLETYLTKTLAQDLNKQLFIDLATFASVFSLLGIGASFGATLPTLRASVILKGIIGGMLGGLLATGMIQFANLTLTFVELEPVGNVSLAPDQKAKANPDPSKVGKPIDPKDAPMIPKGMEDKVPKMNFTSPPGGAPTPTPKTQEKKAEENKATPAKAEEKKAAFRTTTLGIPVSYTWTQDEKKTDAKPAGPTDEKKKMEGAEPKQQVPAGVNDGKATGKGPEPSRPANSVEARNRAQMVAAANQRLVKPPFDHPYVIPVIEEIRKMTTSAPQLYFTNVKETRIGWNLIFGFCLGLGLWLSCRSRKAAK